MSSTQIQSPPSRSASETAADSGYALSAECIAALALLGELLPVPESPIREAALLDLDPDQFESELQALTDETWFDLSTLSLEGEAKRCLNTVADCSARVSVRSQNTVEHAFAHAVYYVAEGQWVRYGESADRFRFGACLSEQQAIHELSRVFAAATTPLIEALELSPSDFLAFSMFAQDARNTVPEEELIDEGAVDDAMSLDEVLAFFDDTEEPVSVRLPQDEQWGASVERLCACGVLVKEGESFAIASAYRELAKDIAAEQSTTFTRFDFLDERWVVRELTLFPSAERLYRLGTHTDGSVRIEELTSQSLLENLQHTLRALSPVMSAGIA